MNTAQNPVLAPKPAHLQWLEGHCTGLGALRLAAPLDGQAERIAALFPAVIGWPRIELTHAPELPAEGYRLVIGEYEASLSFSRPAGGFYGLITLGQLMTASGGLIPRCEIEDAPALALRGLMLDISRGRVPTLDTLLSLADKLALLKYNHLELYIEGFSFAYPSFPEMWRDRTPLTPEELIQLDGYCAARFIELVPNQNSLGHMGSWLADEKYRPLAECPDGFQIYGLNLPPTTMNPQDPGALAHVAHMTDDLIPCFHSDYFNVNLDEPFELGHGKNSGARDAGQLGAVYLEYAGKLRDMLAQRGKAMMMWGDFVARHPELAAELPKDILLLEWGYEAEHPFDARAAALRQAGLRFCLCPGTSSWSSFAGITDNMLVNVRSAAAAAHAYGALGLLLTDWGDGGHPQVMPVSYPAYALAASLAWNADGLSEDELATALDTYLFQDDAHVMGRLSLELGRFNRYEEFIFPCRTLAGIAAGAGLMDKDAWERRLAGMVEGLAFFLEPGLLAIYRERYENRGAFDYEGMLSFLHGCQAKLAASAMNGREGRLITREYNHTMSVLRLLADAHAYIVQSGAWTEERRRTHLSSLAGAAQAVAGEHDALWLLRSKPYGVAESRGFFEKIYENASDMLNGG